MAAIVGTTTTFADDAGGSSTHATAAKSTTTGNLLIAGVKWEVGISAQTLTQVTDTAGNSWNIINQTYYGGTGEPRVALAYAANITGNAANVVTFTFSNTACTYSRGFQAEFSGLATASVTDGAAQTNTGTTADYSTASITTSTTGLVAFWIGDYAGLSAASGTPGTPDFTIDHTNSDTIFAYLISSSAQTVTPGASSTGNTQWVALAQAFKDDATQSNAPRSYHYTQQGIR